jgi:hypothetical protein
MRGEELHNLYSSPIIRIIKSGAGWAERVACMREMRNVHKILVEKPEGKRPLGRPKHRWKDIEIHLTEIGSGLDSSGSGQEQVAGSCEHCNEPFGSIHVGNVVLTS